jgi:hypothetical protein
LELIVTNIDYATNAKYSKILKKIKEFKAISTLVIEDVKPIDKFPLLELIKTANYI